MCGRGARDRNNRELTDEERDLILEDDYRHYASYNIAPTQDVPIIIDPWEMTLAYWWLIPSYAEKFEPDGRSMFNKKSEELDKPYWKGFCTKNDVFYRLRGSLNGRTKINTRKPRTIYFPCEDALFWIACLYDNWIDKETGEIKTSFTVLTMEPNDFMKEIHTRMPVLLTPGRAKKWLDRSFADPKSLDHALPVGSDGEIPDI